MVKHLKIATHDYDYLYPIATRRIVADAVDLEIELGANLQKAKEDPGAGFDLVEISLSRHLQEIDQGDDTWIALPLSLRRAFCHRAWFVHQDSELTSFAQLQGRQSIGITEFPATGNTLGRIAARESGADFSKTTWITGPFNEASGFGMHGTEVALPAGVERAPAGVSLLELLKAKEIAAVVSQLPPTGFLDGSSEVKRLLSDYEGAEREYFQRTGIFPAHHVVGIRRDRFEEIRESIDPIVDALTESKALWNRSRLKYSDTSPWLMPQLEMVTELMGADWQPFSVDSLEPVIEILNEELVANGLLGQRVDPQTVFREYLEHRA